jgi:outer membrane protein TolC
MKKFSIITLLIISAIRLFGQEPSISLQQCYMQALKNYPLSSQKALYEKNSQLQIKNYEVLNLPQINLNGQATYQSAVTELPISLPNVSIPEIKRDQFKVSLDASQVIYGGGTTEQQKVVENTTLAINQQSIEADLYKLKERINQVYFSILLCNNTKEILKVSREEVEARLKKVDAGVKNGAVLPFNATILKAELLKIEQKQIETASQKQSLVSMLSVLTGTTIAENAIFTEPNVDIQLSSYQNLRPEYKLFDLQKQKVDAMKNLTLTKNNPRVFAFGNLGYGRPGLNMFKEEADLFYIVGAKVSWNFWNWHQTKREMQILDINSEILENQKKTYDLNTRASMQQYLSDISKTGELLKTDEEIISLRKEITMAASSQMDNGIITATEYLTEYNAEVQTRLSKSLHEIQLLQAKAAYQATIGGL